MLSKTQRQWHITKINRNTHVAEDGERTEYVTGAHCPACCYAELVGKYGGNVDLRGLAKYGACYQFLAVMVRGERDEASRAALKDA